MSPEPHVHTAACRPPWRPWEPRQCERCGAWECQTGHIYAGCLRCGGTGSGNHPGHGDSGPTGAMRGPLLCWPCFTAWRSERNFDARQEALGL